MGPIVHVAVRLHAQVQVDVTAGVSLRAGRAFAYNRGFTEAQLRGFCKVCRYREFCRGGCTWTQYTQGSADNPYCFYYQAVRQRRHDLLEEEPSAVETAHFDSVPA